MQAQPYDLSYWENYRRLDITSAGKELTRLRMELVGAYFGSGVVVVDVGIGGGRFVSERPRTMGFDVNPTAVAWLKANRLWLDPYSTANRVPGATFWDSFEHIHDPYALLDKVGEFVFMSLPIFENMEHVLRSKHFKKTEHCWYFTELGLLWFMAGAGFELRHADNREESVGREGIGSFVFQRKGATK